MSAVRVCPHWGTHCLCAGKECPNKPRGWGAWSKRARAAYEAAKKEVGK